MNIKNNLNNTHICANTTLISKVSYSKNKGYVYITIGVPLYMLMLFIYKSRIININICSHQIISSIPYDSLLYTSFLGRKFMI